MLSCFDFVREMNLLSVTVRLVLATVCGGLIGFERELKHRPAGFRTHILICLGSAVTVMTNLYLYLVLHLFTDVSRLGAQVIAGIGFIGAGTIIVTKRQRVKGLTTAAGLWTSAIIGLACGAGYVECAVFATAMVLLAELLLIKLEYRFARKTDDVNLLVEYSRAAAIEDIINRLKDEKVILDDLEINRIYDGDDIYHFCAVINLKTSQDYMDNVVIKTLNSIEDVMHVEEL